MSLELLQTIAQRMRIDVTQGSGVQWTSKLLPPTLDPTDGGVGTPEIPGGSDEPLLPDAPEDEDESTLDKTLEDAGEIVDGAQEEAGGGEKTATDAADELTGTTGTGTGAVDEALGLGDIQIELRVRILDEKGDPASDFSWAVGAEGESLKGKGGDIVPTPEQALETITLGFEILQEHTRETPPVARRTVQAAVRLSAGDTSTDWIDLPQVGLDVPVIPIPTIALLCEHPGFFDAARDKRNRILILVPGNSPLDGGVEALNGPLNAVLDAFKPLQTGPTPFSFNLLLDTVDRVIGIIGKTADPMVKVKLDAANQIPHLDHELDQGFSGPLSWHHAEDNTSSIVLIGPPGRVLECYNDRDYSTKQGQMNISVGPEWATLVRSLDSDDPDTASEPPNRVSVPHPPEGMREVLRSIRHFDNEISSVRFA